jgi:hypothetical protein
VNGKNPLVQQAMKLVLPMPGDEDDEEYEDGEWDTSEWEDEELPEPMSEDEQVNGAYSAPPRDYSEVANRKPARKRRMPPLPRTPKPYRDPDAWEPPFEVLPDGSVTGPKLGDGDPTRLPEGFDPERGSFEGVMGIFRPPGSGGEGLPR